jgi:hypothetical protein
MRISWFDAREAQAFGANLAETFSAKCPVIENKKDLTKRAKLLRQMVLDAKQFGQTHKLNIYKKAKLGNAFKWILLEKGYDAQFTDELTKEVILALK